MAAKVKASTEDMLHVTKWHNGEKRWSPFSDKEMSRRQNELRAKLAELKIDAVLFTSYHNICYYSGFLYCYFGRKYGMVIDQKNATTVTAGIDGGQPYRRTFGDNITYTDWKRDSYFTAVKSLTKGVKRLGIEFDHVSIAFKKQLEDAFPGVELVDIADPAMWLRTIKSAEEHKHIRECARICNVGARAVMGAIKAGVPEHEVALASTNAMVREIGKSFPFVELMDTWTWFQSGLETDGAHNPVTNKKIEKGDILSLNCFPMIFGYYTAIERTLFCQTASNAHIDSVGEELRSDARGLRSHEAGQDLRRDCPGAERSLPQVGPDQVPLVRLRTLLRRAQPLLRPRGWRGTARGCANGTEARHGRQHGADDHDPGRQPGRGRLPRARHLHHHGQGRRKHHQLPLWPRAHDHQVMMGPLALAPFAEFRVLVGKPLKLGRAGFGEARIVPIEGGSVEGPGLSGGILPGGSDEQAIREDGLTRIHARYVIEAEGGALIKVDSRGVRSGPREAMLRLLNGEAVDPSLIYFVTAIRFETAAPALDHLNHRLYLARGVREPACVKLSVYEVL